MSLHSNDACSIDRNDTLGATDGIRGSCIDGLAAASEATETCDAIVVGAGVAGLAAAQILRRHGLSVIVLEANDYVGG